MSKYATTQTFGGHLAAVGMTVVLSQPRHDKKPGTCLRAGMIVAVSSTTDTPWVMDLKHPELCSKDVRFVSTNTEAQINDMPPHTWTWPLYLNL